MYPWPAQHSPYLGKDGTGVRPETRSLGSRGRAESLSDCHSSAGAPSCYTPHQLLKGGLLPEVGTPTFSYPAVASPYLNSFPFLVQEKVLYWFRKGSFFSTCHLQFVYVHLTQREVYHLGKYIYQSFSLCAFGVMLCKTFSSLRLQK